MGENNFLSAYKLINSQLVLSNQKLKEEMKDKIEMINSLNEENLKYREENKSLRDMVQKLVEQFRTITTIMVSVRDQSESVFNMVHNKHTEVEKEQQQRRPVAGLIYAKRRTECPPYVDESAIAEGEDENRSMEDYRTADSLADVTEEEEEEDSDARHQHSLTPSRSPLMKRLERRSSKNRSIDESFETIDTNKVVAVARRSQEYLLGRESNPNDDDGGGGGGHHNDGDESSKELSTATDDMDISQITVDPPVVVEVDGTTRYEDDPSVTLVRSALQASSFSDQSGVPSDQSTQSELIPTTDQSLRPVSIKRMASDSMLNTLVDRDTTTNNKENNNSTLGNNDTISNATCSTPLATKKSRANRLKAGPGKHHLSPLSPVPMVALKPLTRANLNEHNISFDTLKATATTTTTTTTTIATSSKHKKVKIEQLEISSDQCSVESNDSKRPRRRAAPKTLKEPTLNTKMRRK